MARRSKLDTPTPEQVDAVLYRASVPRAVSGVHGFAVQAGLEVRTVGDAPWPLGVPVVDYRPCLMEGVRLLSEAERAEQNAWGEHCYAAALLALEAAGMVVQVHTRAGKFARAAGVHGPATACLLVTGWQR